MSRFGGDGVRPIARRSRRGDPRIPETGTPQDNGARYAPYTRLSRVAVSMRAKWYLRKAGINVSRPGSHTLRHTCVQRLVDSGFSLKTIGDFIGHRTPDATQICAKVNIECLRQVALGVGEEVL